MFDLFIANITTTQRSRSDSVESKQSSPIHWCRASKFPRRQPRCWRRVLRLTQPPKRKITQRTKFLFLQTKPSDVRSPKSEEKGSAILQSRSCLLSVEKGLRGLLRQKCRRMRGPSRTGFRCSRSQSVFPWFASVHCEIRDICVIRG